MSTSREDDALPYLEHLLAFARQGWTSLAFVPTEVLLRRYLGRRWEVSRWGGVPEAGAPQGRSTAGQEHRRAGAGQEQGRSWAGAEAVGRGAAAVSAAVVGSGSLLWSRSYAEQCTRGGRISEVGSRR